MSEQWQTVPLGSAARFYSGTGFPERYQGSTSGDIPFFKVSDMSREGNEIYLQAANNYVSAEVVRRQGWRVVPAGSVAFAKVGAALLLNRRRKLRFDCLVDNNIMAIEPQAGVSTDWLYWQLQRVDFRRIVQDGALPSINQGQIAAIDIPNADAAEQSQVSSLLNNLDTTIRQTEAIIEKLKQMQRGLLHDLLTRGIDANGELRPPQSLASHLYKDSPLGWIPREWEAGPLSSWLEGRPKNGYSPQPAGRWTGIQMLGLGCLTANGFEPRQLKDAPLGDPLVPKAFLVPGNLLMSRANTRELVGLVGTYRDVGTPCCYPDLMMRLTPNVKAFAAFLELVLRSPQARRQIQASASGTSGSMVKISSAIVVGLSIAMPVLAEQGRILECLGVSDRRLTAEVALVEQLLALKAGLMDDLLTGRVRVTPLLA